MSYHPRASSPGSRRLANPGRTSDNSFDSYYTQRHNSYTSPRSSQDRVIPISTQTFVNIPPTTSSTSISRPAERFESYSGRPRRSSLVDSNRGPISAAQLHHRTRPTVVQDNIGRPASPLGRSRDREYYVQPASSKEPKEPKEPRKIEHKKLYSVDGGSANLVADMDIQTGGERHHRRRDSVDRVAEHGVYRSAVQDRERDTGRAKYYLNGASVRRENKNIDDDDAFSYTDAAHMYAETEPRWREREVRPRRGSVDRGGASRERPVSMLDPSAFGADPRRSTRDIGPPPSARGWDKINDSLGRTRSVRDAPRGDVPRSPSRSRAEEVGGYGDPRDPYYVPPRRSSVDRANRTLSVQQDRPVERGYDPYGSDFEERREPRRHERRLSASRPKDQSVERRGFGIRPESRDRFGLPARGSDESFERKQRDLARDSGYAEEPRRRDTAPEVIRREPEPRKYQDDPEQYKRDRIAPLERLPVDERDRQYHREPRAIDMRRRDDRGDDEQFDRERDRPKDRGKERDRDYDRECDRDRDRVGGRPHHRRETADHDRDHDRGSKDSGDGLSGATLAAGGGLAGAAAAFGLTKHHEKEKDRERERERDREREKQREREREHQPEPDRLPKFEENRERPRDRRNKGLESHSDEAPFERPGRDPYADPDRGLGFAFEAPEPPKPQREPQVDHDKERERVHDQQFERQHESGGPPVQMPKPAIDPDEDYRRRMEQVQRELGHVPGDHANPEPGADRERRRREREQRQAARGDRLGMPAMPNGEPGDGISDQPAPLGLRGSFEDESDFSRRSDHTRSDYTESSAAARSEGPALKRQSSILDRPMNGEPGQMAQIIDNSMSEKRENRVRIVDPPTDEEEKRPRGILKKPTQKFPEDPNAIREGVAPLKDASKKGIPPGARWTKIDRRLVNPEALEEAKERFEERLDCVIVLRVLTKEDIQKLADRTREIRGKTLRFLFPTPDRERSSSTVELRSDYAYEATSPPVLVRTAFDTATSTLLDVGVNAAHDSAQNGPKKKPWSFLSTAKSGFFSNILTKHSLTQHSYPADERAYEEERADKKAARRRERNRDRHDRDEFSDDSEDEFKPKPPRMLEAPSSAGTSAEADFIRDNRDRRGERERERDREPQYMSGGRGSRD